MSDDFYSELGITSTKKVERIPSVGDYLSGFGTLTPDEHNRFVETYKSKYSEEFARRAAGPEPSRNKDAWRERYQAAQDEFNEAVSQAAPKKEVDTVVDSAANLARAFGAGAAGAARSTLNVFGGGETDAAKFFGRTAESWQKAQTPTEKILAQRDAQEKQRAAEVGVGQDIWTQATNIRGTDISSGAGSLLVSAVGGGAGAGARLGLRALGAARAAAVAPKATAAILGAAQGVGGLRTNRYDAVKQNALQQGYSEADAEQFAIDAMKLSAGETLGAAALGAADSLIGAESAFIPGTKIKISPGTSRFAVPKTVGGAALKETGQEAGQTGAEEYLTNEALINYGLAAPGTEMKGVAGKAAAAGIIGGILGSATGTYQAATDKTTYIGDIAKDLDETKGLAPARVKQISKIVEQYANKQGLDKLAEMDGATGDTGLAAKIAKKMLGKDTQPEAEVEPEFIPTPEQEELLKKAAAFDEAEQTDNQSIVTASQPTGDVADGAKPAQFGTYIPSETGSQPNTEAPLRLAQILDRETGNAPITVAAAESLAREHEKGYSQWAEQDTSPNAIRREPEGFIKGTVDNILATAYMQGMAMDPAAEARGKARADQFEAERAKLEGSSRYELGDRTKPDGTLATETEFQQQADKSNLVPVRGTTKKTGVESLPDSILSAFPSLTESDSGLISLNQFTQDEQDALRKAGLVQDGTLQDGETHEGVDPNALWPERQRRSDENRKNRKGVSDAEKRAGAEKRAQIYERLAQEQESLGELGDQDRAAEYRAKAAEIRSNANKASQPKTEAQAAEEVTPVVESAPAATTVAEPETETASDKATPADTRLGVNNTPLSEGGKPFKTKQAAQKAKKLQPAMRVVAVDGGYALADKTPAQLAAAEKAAKRLRTFSSGTNGKPMSAHEFIVSKGGLSTDARADLGVDGNPRVGNRRLFATSGKGLTLARAAEMLKQEGYINDESENSASSIIRRSLTNPQYTPDGVEQIAEAERDAQFEDYLAAEQEAAEDSDPFSSLDDIGYIMSDADGTGYNNADPDLQREVNALIAQLDAISFDAVEVLDPIIQANQEATQDEYNKLAKAALEQAIAKATKPEGDQDSRRDDAEQGQPRKQGEAEGLTVPAATEAAPEKKLPTAPAVRKQIAKREAEAKRDEAELEKSKVDVNSPENKGMWKIVGYDERTKLENYIDGRGEERIRKIVDWDKSETSSGSGRKIGYLFELEHKETGERRIFGRETAHIAMGVTPEVALQKAQKLNEEKARVESFDKAMAKGAFDSLGEARAAAKPGEVTYQKNGVFANMPDRPAPVRQAVANGWTEAEALTSPTPADILAQEAAKEKAAADKKAADAKADREEAKARERKEIAQRSQAAAETFELGQDAEANLSGQGGFKFSRVAATPFNDALVVTHNLTVDNLIKADEIGGLPAPSIGVTKASSPFGAFGDITMIASKDMADPEKGTPVFDRDAYTARFPSLNFKKPLRKKADALYERMKSARERVEDGFVSQLWDALVNASNTNPEKIAQLFERYESPKMMYAKEVLGKDIKVPMRDVRVDFDWANDKAFIGEASPILKKLNEMSALDVEGSPEFKQLADLARARMNAYIEKPGTEGAKLAEVLGKDDALKSLATYWGNDGKWASDESLLPGWKFTERLNASIKNAGKKETDTAKLSTVVNKVVPRNDAGYVKWYQDLIKPLFDAPTITLRGKEVPLTLDNIVDAMTVGPVAGSEKTMTTGAGKVSAMLGKRFKSLDEIKAARSQVVSTQQEGEAKKATDKLLSDYRDKAVQFFTEKDYRGNIDTWAGNDAAMEALAAAGKGALTDGNIRTALQRKGFRGVDQETVNLARQSIEALRGAVTDYFEAKPQRAVRLNEFRGAVVPKGTDQQALDILEKNGITVIEYNPKKEGDRDAKLAKLSKQLDKDGKDILFSQGAAQKTGNTVAKVNATLKSEGLDKNNIKVVQSWTPEMVAGVEDGRYSLVQTGGAAAGGRGTNEAMPSFDNASGNFNPDLDKYWINQGKKEINGEGMSDAEYNTAVAEYANSWRIDELLEKMGWRRRGSSNLSASTYYQKDIELDEPNADGEDTLTYEVRVTDHDDYHPADATIKKRFQVNFRSSTAQWADVDVTPDMSTADAIAALEDIFSNDQSAPVSGGSMFSRATGNIGTFDPANPDIRYRQDSGVQGFYNPANGEVTLVADNIPQGKEAGVALHEIFHRAEEAALTAQQRAELTSQVKRWRLRDPKTNERKIFDAATKRAKESGDESGEFLAYAVEEAKNLGIQPNAKKGTISAEGWLAKVKKYFTAALEKLAPTYKGELNADHLVDIAYGIAARDAEMQAQGEPLPKTIEVDGKQRPTTNSNGQQIASTADGVRNFWRWFGDSKVVDKQGRPMVMYHGTDKKFNEFKPQKGLRGNTAKQQFWEVELPIYYFTPDENYAKTYGDAKNSVENYVMPVYLRAKWMAKLRDFSDIEEYTTDTEEQFEQQEKGFWQYIEDAKFREKLLEDWDDGTSNTVVVFEEYEGMEYVVFSPTQIKSATSNIGTFDPANPDIRYSRQPLNIAQIEEAAKTGRLPTSARPSLQQIEDAMATVFVDSTRPHDIWARTQDPELAAELVRRKNLAPGRIASFERQMMNAHGNDIAQGIGAIAKRHGLTFEAAKELAGDWMSARYAPIANQYLMQKDQKELTDAISEATANPTPANRAAVTRARNQMVKRARAIAGPATDPTVARLEAGVAGGYTDAMAKKLQGIVEQRIPKKDLEALAEMVYDLNEWKLDQDLKSGRVTPKMVAQWPQSRLYVPLTGDPRSDQSEGSDMFSTGSVNQSKDKAIGGRTSSLAQNAIDATFEQVDKAAKYHGWAPYKDSLHNWFEKTKSDLVAGGATEQEAAKQIADSYGITRAPETMQRPGDNAIIYRKGGKGWVYDLGNQDAVAALKSSYAEPLSTAAKFVAIPTRFLARNVTQFLPGFGPLNMIRDAWEKSENIRTRGEKLGVDMNKVGSDMLKLAADPRTLATTARVSAEGGPLEAILKLDPNDPDQKDLKEFLEAGGGATWGDFVSSDSKSLNKKLEGALTLDTAKGGWGMTKVAAGNLVKGMEVWNNAFELKATFAAYQAMVKNGIDKEVAAEMALELMNFRKGGTVMKPIKAAYMFAQPIATGGQQMYKTLKTPRGRRRFYAMVGIGMALYAMLRSGYEDEETGENLLDKESDYLLERNIPIKIPGTNIGIKIPVGFGTPQLAWGTAINLDRFLWGKQTAGETVANLSKMWVKTMAPVAPSEASISNDFATWLGQTVTPTFLKPIINVGFNKNSFGGTLNPQDGAGDKADALKGKRTTAQEYKDFAKFVAAETGVDTTPEAWRELSNYLAGPLKEFFIKPLIEGPNREEINKTLAAAGKETAPVISTMFDRFVYSSSSDSIKQRLYYRYRDEMVDISKKQSLGEDLSPREKEMMKVYEKIKSAEGRARQIMAQASKSKSEMQKERAKIEHAKAMIKIERDTLTRMNSMRGLD